MVETTQVEVQKTPSKPEQVPGGDYTNHRRDYSNPREGDTSMRVRFYDNLVTVSAEAWYEATDCSDGAHGWKYASRTNNGKDGERPSHRSDCGNAELNEKQVEDLHEKLGEWLRLRKIAKAQAAKERANARRIAKASGAA